MLTYVTNVKAMVMINHVDENGDLICACIECPFFEYDPEDDYGENKSNK